MPLSPKVPYQLTAQECRQELDAEHDLSTLRAIVAARRVLNHMRAAEATGTIEGHVQTGVLKGWRYPETVAVVAAR